MCGIAAILPGTDAALVEKLADALKNRGPDYQGRVVAGNLTFLCSVLHIQGETMVRQPIVNDVGIFCWNGEVFGGLEMAASCDTDQVFDAITKIFTETSSQDENLIDLMSRIWGPYSFLYFNRFDGSLYFGRDPFGRRSLVTFYIDNVIVAISSTSCEPSPIIGIWNEVKIGGIFKLTSNGILELLPWPRSRLLLQRPPSSSSVHTNGNKTTEMFLNHLLEALRRRISRTNRSDCQKCCSMTCQPIAVLFSGGIDSVLLAAALHLCLENQDLSIDLINVSFSDNAPDRLASIAALVELKTLFPLRPWRLIHVDVTEDQRQRSHDTVTQLINPSSTVMDLNIGTALWFAASSQGYLKDYWTKDKDDAYAYSTDARPLVRLGEEGARSSVGLHDLPIDREVRNSRCSCGRVRKAGCLRLLCRRCCLKFECMEEIECPVHWKSKKMPVQSIQYSVDAEIPCGEIVCSCCRVVLVGFGADEQMAGYGRHKTVFLNQGSAALNEELNKDLSRLWVRNLGRFVDCQCGLRFFLTISCRDDRVISDNGKEAWFPYLDEAIVSFLQSLPLQSICDLTLPQGVGDKKILRDAAALVGLRDSSQFVKRAIQFGTRIAKATNIQYFGSNRKGKADDVF